MTNKYFLKFKKDKSFRRNVIIGTFLFLFFGGFLGGAEQAVSAETCDSHNSGGLGYILYDFQYNDCIADECTMQYNYDLDEFGLIGNVGNIVAWLIDIVLPLKADFATCTVTAATGKYVLADSQSAANKQCSSEISIKQRSLVGDDLYKCKEGDPANKCKAWEKPFAELVDAVWKESGIDDCGIKAIMVLAFAGFAVLAII